MTRTSSRNRLSGDCVLMVEPTGRGSHHRYTLNLCRELHDAGIHVNILSSNRNRPFATTTSLTAMKESRLFAFPLLGTIARILDRSARLLINNRKLLREIRTGNYSILHLQILQGVFLRSLGRACRKNGTAMVVTRHNIRSHYKSKKLWNDINQWCFLRNLHQIDAFIAHTPYHKRGLERDGIPAGRIRIIPYGPHPESGVPRRFPREIRSVLMAGTLRPNKGVDTLLSALAILDSRTPEEAPEISVRIVGRAPDRVTARRIAAAAENLQRIHLEHTNQFLRGGTYLEFFIRSRILVLPYTRDFFSLSGILLDGYLYDNDLLVTDSGANGETVREEGSGIVVPPEDPPALAEALAAMLERPPDPQQSANRARALRERFNWKKAALGTKTLYLDLVHEKVSP